MKKTAQEQAIELRNAMRDFVVELADSLGIPRLMEWLNRKLVRRRG
jgi:hypothetical protein